MDLSEAVPADTGRPPVVTLRPVVAEFTDPAVEADFRKATDPEEARRLRATLLFGAAVFPLFSLPDLLRTGFAGETSFFLVTELVVTVVCLAYATRLRRRPEVVADRRIVTAIEVLAMAALLAVVPVRPEELAQITLAFGTLALALFAFVPNRFVLVVGVVGGGLVAFVGLATWTSPPEVPLEARTFLALGVMVVMGGVVGRTVSRTRREEYARLLMERWSNGRLVAEISRRRELEEELTWLADHDELTDLLNRRAFFERAEQELSRARRSSTPVAILVIDADHFKTINDRFGHHTGDEAIRAIAHLCRAHLRANDVVGRIGGEEFAVVLPGSDTEHALDVAARLREEVAASPIEHPGGAVELTVSIGVAGCRLWGETVQDAMCRADLAMYEAKAGGRNRVVAVNG